MIRYYFPALLVFQALLATILWGFPGVWVLAGVPAAFILAATISHWRQPRDAEAGSPPLRPGVIVLGSLFTLVFGVGGMSMMWGATAPEVITIEQEIAIVTPRERLWNLIGDPSQRTQWSPWVADVEPIGRGGVPTVGAEWRATLMLERLAVPSTLKVTDIEAFHRLGWDIVPVGGGQLEDMHEEVSMEPAPARVGETASDDNFIVRYRLSYRVPGVLGRVSERIVIRRPAERMAEEALKALRAVSIGVQ